MSKWHPTKWRYRHLSNGKVIWASGFGDGLDVDVDSEEYLDLVHEQEWDYNNVTDEGEALILDIAFRNNFPGFTNFTIGLSTSAALTESTAYAGRAELTGATGYTSPGISVARSTAAWSAPTGTTPTSITTPSTGTHDWTNSGGSAWSTVNAAFITSQATTDTLIAYNNLSTGRTLQVNDTLQVDFDLNAGGS